MEKLTSKGRGRPRKAISNVGAADQVETSPTINNGHGQDSASGTHAPAQSSRAGEGLSLNELIKLVQNCDDLIATAWHPDAVQDTINTNKSDVRLLKGDPAYQLSSGKIIKL